MKNNKQTTNYFFVDEAGDPTFYNRYGVNIIGEPGSSKILILGFIRTNNSNTIRKEVLKLQNEVINDKYFFGIPSIEKTKKAFHAKDDIPEVRERMFRLIKDLDFKTEFVIARKLEKVFLELHNRNENQFYDNLISRLFENQLHKSRESVISFAVRGSKTRQAPFEEAIQSAIRSFEQKWNKKVQTTYKVEPQSPRGEPCLQVIDYMLWALYRAINQKEMRYINFVLEKVSLICDLYDFSKYPKNYYNRRNIFDINKISPI